jgi:hypothetical protein
MSDKGTIRQSEESKQHSIMTIGLNFQQLLHRLVIYMSFMGWSSLVH